MLHSIHRFIRFRWLIVTLVVPGSLSAQDSTLFFEDFDAVSPPDLPTGWTSTPEGAWSSSASVSSPGSGGNNMVVSGGDSAVVVTPPLDLSQLVSGVFSYAARRTSTFPADGIIVEASTDAGQTFPIVVVDSSASLPSTASDYETISAGLPPALIGATSVQFRFRAFGSGGGNCRLDDIAISGSGQVGMTSFGFAQPSSIAAIGADSFRVDLSLRVTAAVGELHGLQFDLTWPVLEEIVAVERGPAVVDEASWEVTAQLDTSPGRVVVLSRLSGGLVPGDYTDFLTLVLAPAENGGTARDDTLEVSGIIGSRSSDTGDDAYVTSGVVEHVISVLPAIASFSVSSDSLDFGVVDIDSIGTESIVIGNPLGNVDLEVSSTAAALSGISVEPDTFSVPPGDSLTISIEADGSVLPIGPFGGYVIFNHNASADPDSVWVYGRVGSTSSRGDVNDDGITDLVDLVLAVDHVVGITPLDPEFQERVDLYPFPDGDDGVDVRDLTILVRAINSGVWPDGVLLPAPAFASKIGSGPAASLYILERAGSSDIRLSYAPGLRAVHLLLTSDSGLDPSDLQPEDRGEFVQIHVDRYEGGADGIVGVLAFTLDGTVSRDPEFTLAEVNLAADDSLRVLFATGVDLANQRVQIEFADAIPPDELRLTLSPPFPQPFSISRHERLYIQSASQRPVLASVRIGDVLGRTVYSADARQVSRSNPFTWRGATDSGSQVSPGLYFVRFTTDEDLETVPVIVMP